MSRSQRRITRPPLQNPNEHITSPEDAMQLDLVLESHPSGGFEKIVTAMDVFCCFLLAYLTSNQDAKTIPGVKTNIMTNHAYFPTTIILDKASVFMSHVITEVAVVLIITFKARHNKARANEWHA